MKPIVTLTLNPCIDGASETETIHPTHKIRTTNSRYDPGGGGINVARVIAELGGTALPVYLSGGATGRLLGELLMGHPFEAKAIEISDGTRISHAVRETSTGMEYRFVPEGPTVTPDEWSRCLTALRGLDFDFLVASGSPPKGVPENCYVEIGKIVAEKGARLVLDTSGKALRAAITSGHILLAKPSHGEFSALLGRPLESADDIAEAARDVLSRHDIGAIAVTMGHGGAILVTPEETKRLAPPYVKVRSAVGAGDSFLGAMVYSLAAGKSMQEAFAYGVAAGTAAVITPGTELCRKPDVERMLQQLHH